MPAGDLRQLSKQCSKMTDEWLRASVDTARKQLEEAVARDVGRERVLSGARIRLGVTGRVGDGDATVAAAPRGPWRWVTEGTFNRPQGGSSPAKGTFDRAAQRILLDIGQDADRRFGELA